MLTHRRDVSVLFLVSIGLVLFYIHYYYYLFV